MSAVLEPAVILPRNFAKVYIHNEGEPDRSTRNSALAGVKINEKHCEEIIFRNHRRDEISQRTSELAEHKFFHNFSNTFL